MNFICQFCGANFWYDEKITNSPKSEPKFSICCSNGRIKLQEISEPPEPLRSLFLHTHPKASHFMKYIRAYNSNFALASLGMF